MCSSQTRVPKRGKPRRPKEEPLESEAARAGRVRARIALPRGHLPGAHPGRQAGLISPTTGKNSGATRHIAEDPRLHLNRGQINPGLKIALLPPKEHKSKAEITRKDPESLQEQQPTSLRQTKISGLASKEDC